MSFLDFPGLQYFYNKYLKPIKPHAREETIKSYTVNEQGHVPDAQLVVQLKEENESLQEEIEKLNSALNYFNAVDDVTGSNFRKNFWLINPDDKTSEINKNSFFAVTQTDRAEWKNIPPDMPNQTIIGMREVFVRNSQHVLVQITEFHPIAGRRYCSMYNNGSWSEWKTYNPS